MPISGFEVIHPHMVRVISALKPVWGPMQEPVRILDIGIGTGQWGFLFRNYVDYAHGRIAPGTQRLELIGVEGFKGYRNPGWKLYDDVIITNIQTAIQSDARLAKRWTFINMIEVLEHLDKADGIQVLRWIGDHSDHMMFSFHNGEQGPWGGNDLEQHRAKWSVAELQELLPGTELVCGDANAAYLWRSAPIESRQAAATSKNHLPNRLGRQLKRCADVMSRLRN